MGELLTDHHHVYTPGALGHHGGPPVQRRPVTMNDVVEAAERYLDERGLDRPHLAGDSMGAYVAIELARRGRAATVCALSPPGLRSAGDGLQARAFATIRRNLAAGRFVRPAYPLLSRSAAVRRIACRDAAAHGDRLTPAQAVERAGGSLDGAVPDVVKGLSADAWQIAPLQPLPCPVTVAWSEKDTLLPMAEYTSALPERLPGAEFTVLADVGHEAMLDDPGLVACTILAGTGAATA